MPRWLIVLLFLGNLALIAARPLQANVQISAVSVVYTYADKATFQAQLNTPSPVKDVFLFIQPKDGSTRVEKVDPGENGQINFVYDLKQSPLLPFTETSYWFRVTLANGLETTSPTYQFNYDDNRFKWELLEDSRFQVRWYSRDLAFGQQVLNVANEGLKSAQAVLPANLPAPARIFVYSSAVDLQQALQISGQSWLAGHASPEIGTVVISIPPGPEERLELERQIPHELTHLLQYQLAGQSYNRVPGWFLEGTASLAELYPNPDYQNVLANASANNSLIPLEQLCGAFPREASGAFLAYAEVTSFTRFLHQNYGTSGLETLLKQYQDGISCAEGPNRALGASLNDLDVRWQQEVLGLKASRRVLGNLSPYLALLALLVGIPLLVGLPRISKSKS